MAFKSAMRAREEMRAREKMKWKKLSSRGTPWLCLICDNRKKKRLWDSKMLTLEVEFWVIWRETKENSLEKK